MNTIEAPHPLTRPPGAVIAMSFLWFLGACAELLLWFINREPFFLVVAIIAAAFAVVILKGYRWVFWTNLVILSLSLGMTLVQFQLPNYAAGSSKFALLLRIGITLVLLVCHELRSVRSWFRVRGAGRRWHILFWVLVGGLTVLGQFILPVLTDLGEYLRQK